MRGEEKKPVNTPPPSPHSAQGTVLGFDFGLKRIGVAVGDLGLGLAHPLTTVTGESNDQRFSVIGVLLREWQPVLAVVGMPTHADGGEHDMSARCRRFAHQLEGRFGLKTAFVDESLSSAAASEDLNEAGVRGRRQKTVLDQVAAQRILQSYLDQQKYELTRS